MSTPSWSIVVNPRVNIFSGAKARGSWGRRFFGSVFPRFHLDSRNKLDLYSKMVKKTVTFRALLEDEVGKMCNCSISEKHRGKLRRSEQPQICVVGFALATLRERWWSTWRDDPAGLQLAVTKRIDTAARRTALVMLRFSCFAGLQLEAGGC